MKSRIIGIIITLVVLAIVGILVANFVGRRGISVPTVPTGGGVGEEVVAPAVEVEEPIVEEPVVEEKTPIEIAFEKANDVEISGAKAKAVDEVLRPVLKGVFDTIVDEEVIVGVKMREEFGPMLTYSFNRKVTETERDAIISGLAAVDVNAVDTTEKIITVQKGSDMWVITFYLNNEEKSGLELTF